MQFQGRTTVKAKGGVVTNRDGVLTVENADEAIIYTSIGTNFNNYKDITGDYIGRAKDYLPRPSTRIMQSERQACEVLRAISEPHDAGFG